MSLYLLRADFWSQNPLLLGHDFVPAVGILENWLHQYRRDQGRQNRMAQLVVE
jgi:hypothetical protein